MMAWRRNARHIWARMTADPRRFGLLCTLLAVGLLLWARIIVISRMPRTAIAEERIVVAEVMDPAAGSSDNPASSLHGFERGIRPTRDPFRVNDHYFPPPGRASSTPEEGPKSAPAWTEDPEDVLGRIRLEAVMRGFPLAVIDGRTCGPGDVVRAVDSELEFELVETRRRSVVLRCGDRTYELSLASPVH